MPGADGMSVVKPPVQTIAVDGATRPVVDYEAWMKEGKMMVRAWWALIFNITVFVVIHCYLPDPNLIGCYCLIFGPLIGIWHFSEALLFAYQGSRRWPLFLTCSVLAFWNTLASLGGYGGYPFS